MGKPVLNQDSNRNDPNTKIWMPLAGGASSDLAKLDFVLYIFFLGFVFTIAQNANNLDSELDLKTGGKTKGNAA